MKSFSDNLIVATVTAVGYLSTYNYERSFAGYFSIPIDFVEINITKIFITTTSLIALFVVIYFFADFVYTFSPKVNNSVLSLKINGTIILGVFVFFIAYVNKFIWDEYNIWFYFFVFMTAHQFLLPLLTQRGKGGYIDKLTAQHNFEVDIPDLVDVVKHKISPLFILYIIIAGEIILFAGILGNTDAKYREKHYFVNNSNVILLRSYGKYMYCSKYNEKDNSISSDIIIINTDENKDINITLKNTGPLSIIKSI